MRRSNVIIGAPAYFPQDDPLAAVKAVLRIVDLAWTRIVGDNVLVDSCRRDERGTARKLQQYMRRIHCEGKAEFPAMRILSESETSTGRVDIEIIHNLHAEDSDLRLECKRVSSTTSDRRDHLAREYVDEGVLRFVTNKYGRGRQWGIMIAFVIDGLIDATVKLIEKYVSTRRTDKTSVMQPWQRAHGLMDERHLYTTEHVQGGGPQTIHLLHFFLPFPPRA